MRIHNLYRTFMITGAGLAVVLCTACNVAQKSHKEMVKVKTDQWNITRLQVLYEVANQQYKTGDYDKCRESLREALATNTPYAPMHILAARVDLEGANLENAANHLKDAVRLTPKDPEPYYLLGVVYQRWQKLDVACDYYQQAWDLKTSEARFMLAVIEMKISMGQLDEAQQVLEDKMVYFEQTGSVRVALARIAILKHDFAAASKHYRDAYLLMPDDPQVKRSCAESLFFSGKYADAVPILEDMRQQAKTAAAAATAENPNAVNSESDRATATLMLGRAYLNLHRPANAKICFQDILRDNPENLPAILGLGSVCVEMDELPAAIAAGRRVLKSEPRNTQAMILIAMVQQKQKKWADALTTLNGAATVAPKDTTVLCMQGVTVQRLGKPDDAIAYFERAVAANPKDTWATELLNRARPVTMPKAASQGPENAAPTLTAQTPEPVTAETPTTPENASVTTAAPTGPVDAP